MRTKCQRLKGKLGETVAGATQLDVMLAFCTGLVQSYSTGLVPARRVRFLPNVSGFVSHLGLQQLPADFCWTSTQLDRDFPSKLHVDRVALSNNVALL